VCVKGGVWRSLVYFEGMFLEICRDQFSSYLAKGTSLYYVIQMTQNYLLKGHQSALPCNPSSTV
jgi:hypothetical protein